MGGLFFMDYVINASRVMVAGFLAVNAENVEDVVDGWQKTAGTIARCATA